MNTWQSFYQLLTNEETSIMLKLVQVAFEKQYIFISLSISVSINIYDHDYVDIYIYI